MTNVNEDNEGWYTCQACNYYGCDRAEAYLRLLDLCALPENRCPEPKVNEVFKLNTVSSDQL